MPNVNDTAIERLQGHILKRIDLSAGELEQMLSAFTPKKVKKKQFIIQPDFVARHRNYIVEGAFHAYVVNEKGEQHTIQLAIEDWWISDYNSYIFQRPATMFVAALEDSTILQLDYEKEQQLKAASHKYETFFRIMAERAAAYQQRRLVAGLMQTATQRYNDFLLQYPAMAQRIPQYALASYLGMTTQFLSRIRNRKSQKS